MSDDIATQVQRIDSVRERLPQLIEHALLLKQSHEGMRDELMDIVGESTFMTEMRSNLNLADRHVDDYNKWMKEIAIRLEMFSDRIKQASGMSGGPFG